MKQVFAFALVILVVVVVRGASTSCPPCPERSLARVKITSAGIEALSEFSLNSLRSTFEKSLDNLVIDRVNIVEPDKKKCGGDKVFAMSREDAWEFCPGIPLLNGTLDKIGYPIPASIDIKDLKLKKFKFADMKVRCKGRDCEVSASVEELAASANILASGVNDKKTLLKADHLSVDLNSSNGQKEKPSFKFKAQIVPNGSLGNTIKIVDSSPRIDIPGDTIHISWDLPETKIKSIVSDIQRGLKKDLGKQAYKGSSICIDSVVRRILSKSDDASLKKEFANNGCPTFDDQNLELFSQKFAAGLIKEKVVDSESTAGALMFIQMSLNDSVFKSKELWGTVQSALNNEISKDLGKSLAELIKEIPESFDAQLELNALWLDDAINGEKRRQYSHQVIDKLCQSKSDMNSALSRGDLERGMSKFSSTLKEASRVIPNFKESRDVATLSHLKGFGQAAREVVESYQERQSNSDFSQLDRKTLNATAQVVENFLQQTKATADALEWGIQQKKKDVEQLRLRSTFEKVVDINKAVQASATSPDYCLGVNVESLKDVLSAKDESKYDIGLQISVEAINKYLDKLYRVGAFDFCQSDSGLKLCSDTTLFFHGSRVKLLSAPEIKWSEESKKHYLEAFFDADARMLDGLGLTQMILGGRTRGQVKVFLDPTAEGGSLNLNPQSFESGKKANLAEIITNPIKTVLMVPMLLENAGIQSAVNNQVDDMKAQRISIPSFQLVDTASAAGTIAFFAKISDRNPSPKPELKSAKDPIDTYVEGKKICP